MKRLIMASLLVASLGALPGPRPADAAVTDCLSEAVNDCDADFGKENDRVIAIRGWCYLIRWGICSWFN